MRPLNFRFLRQKPLYVPRFWLQNSEVLTKALVLKKVPGRASSDKSLRSRRHGENKKGHGSKLSGKKKNERTAEQFPKGLHLNGYTIGFRLHTQKLESPCTA